MIKNIYKILLGQLKRGFVDPVSIPPYLSEQFIGCNKMRMLVIAYTLGNEGKVSPLQIGVTVQDKREVTFLLDRQQDTVRSLSEILSRPYNDKEKVRTAIYLGYIERG